MGETDFDELLILYNFANFADDTNIPQAALLKAPKSPWLTSQKSHYR